MNLLRAGALAMCLLACVAGANAGTSTVEVKVARINDTQVPPAASATVYPGDVIECDGYVSGWKEQLELLDSYQLMIDSAGLVSGAQGVLRPIDYIGPLPLFNVCDQEPGCIVYGRCGEFLCLPPTCPPGGCAPDEVCSTGGWCFRDRDYPLEGSREIGVVVHNERPDFVFFNLSPLSLADISSAPAYRWRSVALARLAARSRQGSSVASRQPFSLGR